MFFSKLTECLLAVSITAVRHFAVISHSDKLAAAGLLTAGITVPSATWITTTGGSAAAAVVAVIAVTAAVVTFIAPASITAAAGGKGEDQGDPDDDCQYC
jgi:hypothetical protein